MNVQLSKRINNNHWENYKQLTLVALFFSNSCSSRNTITNEKSFIVLTKGNFGNNLHRFCAVTEPSNDNWTNYTSTSVDLLRRLKIHSLILTPHVTNEFFVFVSSLPLTKNRNEYQVEIERFTLVSVCRTMIHICNIYILFNFVWCVKVNTITLLVSVVCFRIKSMSSSREKISIVSNCRFVYSVFVFLAPLRYEFEQNYFFIISISHRRFVARYFGSIVCNLLLSKIK